MKKTLIKRKAAFSSGALKLLEQLRGYHEASLADTIFDYSSDTLRVKVNRYLKPYDSHTSHDFRHTRITELANSGMSVKSLQIHVGHASTSTTLRYIHADEDGALN